MGLSSGSASRTRGKTEAVSGCGAAEARVPQAREEAEAHSVRHARRRPAPSVLRQARVDVARPGVDAAVQVAHLAEPGAGEEFEGACRAGA